MKLTDARPVKKPSRLLSIWFREARNSLGKYEAPDDFWVTWAMTLKQLRNRHQLDEKQIEYFIVWAWRVLQFLPGEVRSIEVPTDLLRDVDNFKFWYISNQELLKLGMLDKVAVPSTQYSVEEVESVYRVLRK